ncbi:MAG TPA: hypothetical protein VLH10_15160 [Yinghuangia sp.]|uniref:hypothetical protein n=1 Tax=Yinghuangia sp. YIM S10712 TaxID=3436930 RepID=UPI002CDD3FBF|nr:hypothetical protein [Yinghuangia sp.]
MSEAGVGSFLADILASVFFFLLPDSIADEAQIVFIVAIVIGVLALRIRGAVQRRRTAQAARSDDYSRVATGQNPFSGPPVPGSTPPLAPPASGQGANPFGTSAPQRTDGNPFGGATPHATGSRD